jgi:phosphotransferase family enzyme
VAPRTVWRDRAWRAGAIAWTERRLAELGVRTVGKAEQIHVVPWSTVLRVPTDRGAVYFKATWPPQRHEAVLAEALARWSPDHVTTVLALERRRGWFLAENAGERLREIFAKDRDIRRWHAALPRYAELQLATAPRAAELLKLGAPDRRASALARSYVRLLEDRSLMRVGLKEGLTAAQHQRLRGLVPSVREWAIAISATMPDTIQHDDLHDGQVFVRDGQYRILDWGDACVSHPFYSLSVILRSIAYGFKLKAGSRELARVRDVYLEPFTRIATRKQIRAAYPLAVRLGWISRALSWALVVENLSPSGKRKERGSVPRSLQRFLEATASA